jgi:hypothetical protein
VARLKTLTSARVVPLWPQLEATLRPFIFSRPPTTLLFPSFITGREAMLAELQTLEGGAPVSPVTVSRELGHGSRAMVEEIYATWAPCGTVRRSWNTGSSSTPACSLTASPSSGL